MIKLQFTGTCTDLQAFLSSLPAQLTAKLSVDFQASCTDLETLNEKARRVARPEMEAGRKIGAIKEVRSLTGWGLKEAKEFVEREFPNYVVAPYVPSY